MSKVKYLEAKHPPQAFNYTPYTLEQINGHLDSYKIWATILAIKAECQQECRKAYDRGFRDAYRG